VATGFDPEAEREVDFARYARMLARRWWLVAAGVVIGAVIGYLVSLGGTKVYDATATIYLGQPYNGSTPMNNLQTNPSAVAAIVNSQAVDAKVAAQCKTKIGSFRNGISVQHIATSSTPSKSTAQINPLVTVTVEASKGKVASCTANALARAGVDGVSSYAVAKIRNLQGRIAGDLATIKASNVLLKDPSLPNPLASALEIKLGNAQTDLSTQAQFLIIAKQVEMPRVTIAARQRQVTAQSHKNTVMIAALIGLILGILGALLWDRITPRLSARSAS
jgi:capsular polysaccharide biosynthesis protein